MKEMDRAAVEEALKTIMKNKETKALNYCVEYARYGLHMLHSDEWDEEAMRTQLLYVLSNMTHWRGDEAKQVRKVLKDAVRSK